MSGLNSTLEEYKITRLDHFLQTSTKALKDKASEEMIVAAIPHDIGDELAPLNHSEYTATVLKLFVSEKTHWIIKKHGEFQMCYCAHHLDGNRNQRDKYKDHKYYEDALKRFFVENHTQVKLKYLTINKANQRISNHQIHLIYSHISNYLFPIIQQQIVIFDQPYTWLKLHSLY